MLLAPVLIAGLTVATAADAQDAAALRGEGVPFLIRFHGSIRGLKPGAPVEVQGIRIGEVRNVGVEYAADSNSFVAPVEITVFPSQFPAAGPHPRGADETYAAADALVRRGLRAVIADTLFSGGDATIALVMEQNAAAATLDRTGPVPEIPPGKAVRELVLEKLQPLIDKLADAPIDQAFANIEASTDALKALVTGPELRGALEAMRGAADDLRTTVDRLGGRSDAVLASVGRTIDQTGQTLASLDRQVGDRSPLLADLREAIRELGGAARSMRLLAEYLERNPAALVTGKSDNRR
ncbi:MAG TPA: MlaD family protein [Acetobacteraceae bacterium]|nr:MlaD family protein [Acetobacteraceae bacterium]